MLKRSEKNYILLYEVKEEEINCTFPQHVFSMMQIFRSLEIQYLTFYSIEKTNRITKNLIKNPSFTFEHHYDYKESCRSRVL